jgi:phycoerythrin-associated linker protein
MASQTILELWSASDSEEVQTIIRTVYKQVLGNPHVMESERLVTAESQLCDRSITVRDFVRAVAKSDFYRTRYFESCAPYRFVELNFLHLLGRAPQDQREVSILFVLSPRATMLKLIHTLIAVNIKQPLAKT